MLPRQRDRRDRPRQLDRLGMLLSGLCALHCIAGIVIVTAMGLGGSLLLHPAIHKAGLAIATLIAAVAIGAGALRHRRLIPLAVAVTGLSFMGGALAVGHGTDEMVLTVIGVALVAAGHVLNLRRG